MFKLNGFRLGAALLLLSSTVNASVIISNQQIPDEDILSISITPGTGTLLINTKVDYDVVRSDGSSPTPTPAEDVAITTFRATPNSFVEGGSTVINWVTQNAVSCETANGTSSWLNESVALSSGSATVQIDDQGSYGFTLICKDANNVSVTKNLTVTVTAAPVTGGTECNAAALGGSLDSWKGLWQIDFPQPGYANQTDVIPNRGYKAYKFNTGNIVDNGLIVTVGTTYTSGTRLGSISECPGDFSVPNACSHTWGIGGGITWATDGTTGACQLKPNTDYYMNVTFTDGTNPASASCTGTCYVKFQHVNR